MAWNNYNNNIEDKKAEYNSNQGITEILINLTGSYAANMFYSNLEETYEVLNVILDIISPKLKPEELEKVDKIRLDIKNNIKTATLKHTDEGSGLIYLKDPMMYENIKEKIRVYYREVGKLQDKHGYGMTDRDDELKDFFNA